jgi:hypothetical protein
MGLDTDKVPGVTVNRYCASGSESIAIAAAKIKAGMAEFSSQEVQKVCLTSQWAVTNQFRTRIWQNQIPIIIGEWD